MRQPLIAIIGGGPAGLIAADTLAPHCDVHLYEQGKSVGRKFLVAGQGGFNLTNHADGPELAIACSPPGFLDRALEEFGSGALRAWFRELGVETYIGTSGRVFPQKGIKPIDVLNAIRARLLERGVHMHLEHAFVGFDDAANVIIEHHGVRSTLAADLTLFALGGASWSVTGSTGAWPSLFASLGVEIASFQASNCGVEIEWPASFARDHAGKALKNIGISAGDHRLIGEATITQYGVEGNAVYPVVPMLREALNTGTPAVLRIDLKPSNTTEQLLEKIAAKEPRNYATALNLDRVSLALLKSFTSKERFLSPFSFVSDVKNLPLEVRALRPVEEAISTVGGIRPGELSPDFSLKGHPHLFTVGEMVDWDAPTGGFLLQACFATGRHAAMAILAR